MQRIFASIATVLAVFALHSPVNAGLVSTLGAGVLSDPNAAADGLGGGFADFNTPASITTYGQSSPAQGPFSVGDASFSGNGILMTNSGQDSLGLYAEPFHDTTQYLTVQPNGPIETVVFGTTYQNLGLYWGSMDTYNSIIFYLGGNVVDTVTGSQAAAAIVPPTGATGAQADDSNNRYVIIGDILGGGFDTVVFMSTGNSFEIDNLAWGNTATPLPAALPMFGTVLAGGFLFRKLRGRKTSI